MAFEEKLSRVVARYEELQALMASGDGIDSNEFVKMSKEYSNLEPVVKVIKDYEKMKNDFNDAQSLIEEAQDDPEMKAMAEEEYFGLKAKLPKLERDVKIALIPKDEADDKNAILEVRAGTGGDEAAIFAADLYRMYERYASNKGWKFEVLEVSENGVGGYKEASANISGKDVFARLKYESGAHRVQRVPVTESQGRVHTSAATVAVLPEAQEVDIKIEEKDLRIDTYRASGAGGQHVNKTDSAVRITHEPTGVVVACQDESSQHKNKAKALKILRSRIYEEERRAKAEERAENRKNQVGSGDRSERIRTYNFPQGRVTDHRINLTLYKLDQIMAGEGLDEIIEGLIAEDQASQLLDFE